jgi:hypothetical protein
MSYPRSPERSPHSGQSSRLSFVIGRERDDEIVNPLAVARQR